MSSFLWGARRCRPKRDLAASFRANEFSVFLEAPIDFNGIKRHIWKLGPCARFELHLHIYVAVPRKLCRAESVPLMENTPCIHCPEKKHSLGSKNKNNEFI